MLSSTASEVISVLSECFCVQIQRPAIGYDISIGRILTGDYIFITQHAAYLVCCTAFVSFADPNITLHGVAIQIYRLLCYRSCFYTDCQYFFSGKFYNSDI